MIDVIGADDSAKHFLEEIIFFIGAAGGRETGNGIRTGFRFDLVDLTDDQAIGLIPRCFFQFTVAPDQWSGQAIFVIDEDIGNPTFDTK